MYSNEQKRTITFIDYRFKKVDSGWFCIWLDDERDKGVAIQALGNIENQFTDDDIHNHVVGFWSALAVLERYIDRTLSSIIEKKYNLSPSLQVEAGH